MADSLRFSRFEWRPTSRQLLVDRSPVPLGARAFDVLSALIERRERVVSKEELFDLAWAGLVVEENNLAVQISALRKVLGSHAIATIPGRGYRFTLVVEPADDVASGTTHRHNLPALSSSLIGRERDVAEVGNTLRAARLVTVTGAGGIGKTRLALQVAMQALAEFPDGVWLVEFAPMTEGRLVAKAIASVLSIEERGAPVATLVGELADRRTLLVLDNCEHLIDAVAEVCQALLAGSSGLRVLATSREPLHISGESVYRVPPLATPDATADSSVDKVASAPAVQLFVERARAGRSSFVLEPGNAATVASICRRLDGIPLALELAAARVGSMSIEEVDARLAQRFRLLTAGARIALPRHQTLRALFDWSYDLLPPTEQALLCRLAVFAGGWVLEAAEQVCTGDGVDADAMLDLLSSLVDKNLVLAEERAGSSRYTMLETVRDYAAERLRGRGEEARAKARHVAHFLAVAEEAEAKLHGAEQQAWLDRLERETDNLRGALGRCCDTDGDRDAGLRMAGALAPFWWMRGYLVGGQRWLGELLRLTPSTADPVRMKALRWAAGIALAQGDYATARPLHEEGLVIGRAVGDRVGVATSLIGMGQWIWAQQPADCDAAAAMFEESLAISQALGDRHGIAVALTSLANVASIPRRDYAAARKGYEEALALFRAVGDQHGAGQALTGLANVLLRDSEPARAHELHGEALELAQSLGDQRGLAESLDGLAGAAAALALPLRAARIWGATRRLREVVHCPMATAMLPAHRERVAAARAALGDDAAFERAWQEGEAMSLEDALRCARDGAADYTATGARSAG